MTSPYPDPGQMNIDAAFSSAEALFGQRRFEEASQVYSNVLSALETQYGQTHPELAFPLQRLGDCFHALNRYRESLPLYLRLLDIGEIILGKTHPDMLNLMIKVAKTQELIGSFQESKRTFETVLPLLEKALGPNHELFKSTVSEYEVLNERISENKRAADAWREGSTGAPPGAELGQKNQFNSQSVSENASVPVPGGGVSIAVSDNRASDDAWESASGQPPNTPQNSSAVFGAPKSMPPVPDMPPLPGNPQSNQSIPGQMASDGRPMHDQGDFTGVPLTQEDGAPDWSKSTRPVSNSPTGNPPFPPGGPGQAPAGNSPFPPGGPGQAPAGNSPFPPGGPAQAPPNNPPSPTGGSRSQPPQNFPPANSVGPVTAIPNADAVPMGGLGFEERRNDPSNDPYIDHLATRVSELKPDEVDEDLNLKSGAWHGSDVLKNLDIAKAKESSYQEDDDEFDDEEEEREERKLIRSQKLKAARSAASKSSGLVTIVRGVKEYLITLIALAIFVVGGYYFFTHTEQKRPKLVSEKIVHDGVLENSEHVFHTSDQALRLTLDGRDSCTLFHEHTGIKVPYNYYDGTPTMMALQTLDSLLECQHWFSEVSEGLVTEQGVVYYSHKSPDWKVLTELRRLKGIASNWHQVTGGYPSDLQKVPPTQFTYVNAFTGDKENLKIKIIRYRQVAGSDIRAKILRGARIAGDGTIKKGQIFAYSILVAQTSGEMKSVGFYLRGVNSQGQYFQSSVPGEYLLVGFKGGADDGNEHLPIEEAKLFRTEKPTKVWISKVSQIPVFLIHHSLPLLLGFLGVFFIMRSMMLAPGQSADNHLNRTLRLIGFVIILANLVVIVRQFLLWR